MGRNAVRSGQEVVILTREEFLRHLRDSLIHLHDADSLRRNPLATHFGVANRFDTAATLRSIFTEAIESLKPEADVPSDSRAWRIYDSLFCCYVQQLSQQVVADQLGISTRQLRREQRAALEALADQLWDQFELETRLGEDMGGESTPVGAVVAGPTVSEELAWLKNLPPEEPTDPNQSLASVLDLAQPLAAQHGIRLELETTDALPSLAVHPVALNQVLLNLLSVAIPRASSGADVRILARSLRWDVEILVACEEITPDLQAVSSDAAASLDLAHQLASLCGGRLSLSPNEDAFWARLTLPILEQLPVLAIDDNADTLQLLQRYTSGTRYRLVGTSDPEQALSLAEGLSPQIIVLDVMMPQVDGWKVLGRLRQHPLTSDVPIVVCTILAQEALALSLGASAFIRKPLTRQAFLAALDQQIGLMVTDPG